MSRKLYRSRTDSMIAGVCGGLAEYFNIDTVLMRIAAVVIILVAPGAGILAYLIFWVVVPQKPIEESIAGAENPEQVSAEVDEVKSDRKSGIVFIGAGLIVLGALILLNNFVPIVFFSVGKLWPVALVVVGILILKKGAENKEDES